MNEMLNPQSALIPMIKYGVDWGRLMQEISLLYKKSCQKLQSIQDLIQSGPIQTPNEYKNILAH